jgi:hypothetical protein
MIQEAIQYVSYIHKQTTNNPYPTDPPHPHTVGVPNLLLLLTLAPIEKKTNGSGTMTSVRPASRPEAPTVPNLRYIWLENSGNPAAKEDRSAELLAMALAATGR